MLPVRVANYQTVKSLMLQQLLQLAQTAKQDMPNAYKLAVKTIPRPLRRLLYNSYFESKISRVADVRAVFETIHDSNLWNSTESRSGSGSELARTQIVRLGLEDWLKRHRTEISTFLDAPCGDLNWMRGVAFPDEIRYIGGEIVRALVAENTKNYQSDRRSFIDLDIIKGPLPHVDAWLCRDALIHFPFSAALAVVETFRRSGCKYFLSTTYPTADNAIDIKYGLFRPVNLAIAPFNLGEPLEMIRDTPESDGFLGVWRNPNR